MAGSMCGNGGCTWRGACMTGGYVAGGVRGRREGDCRGRYASSWNAFLFVLYSSSLHTTEDGCVHDNDADCNALMSDVCIVVMLTEMYARHAIRLIVTVLHRENNRRVK